MSGGMLKLCVYDEREEEGKGKRYTDTEGEWRGRKRGKGWKAGEARERRNWKGMRKRQVC